MEYDTYGYIGDDDGMSDRNSTCAQWDSCSPCLDYFAGEDTSGCLWCNVPKGGIGAGLCVSRSRAQDSCEIGELQATCREGVGWYVLVLTLSALLCICCFLTMARKFVSVWHERRWLAAGGDLVRPLLGDEDAEEQAHEAVFRGSLVDSSGTSWRCPVCGFDNRPLCKHCDLCGIGSDFAEAYWKEKNTPKRGEGSTKQRTGRGVDDDKADPKPPSPTVGSSKEAAVLGGSSAAGGRGQLLEESTDEEEEDTGGTTGRRGERGGAGAESEEEAAPLLPRSAFSPLVVPAGFGSIQGDSGGDTPNEGDGESGDERGFGRRTGAAASVKSRVTTFRLRRPASLTERQKRARRRRIWQRVMGPDGKLRWLQTIESPAAKPLPTAGNATSAGGTAGDPSSSDTYQPPLVNAPTTASAVAAAGAAAASVAASDRFSGDEASGRGVGGSVPSAAAAVAANAAAAAANAAAVLRSWSTPRSPRPTPPSQPGDPARETLVETGEASSEDLREAEAGVAVAPADAVDSVLSDVERGEGGGNFGGARAPREFMGSRRDTKTGSDGGEREIGFPAAVAAVSGAEQQRERAPIVRRDSFGDEAMMLACAGYYTTFLDGGGLPLDEARHGALVAQPHPPPPSAARRGLVAGEASPSDDQPEGMGAGTSAGTGPAARQRDGHTWAEGAARRREARREEVASEDWITSSRADLPKLCEVAAKPFWQKHSWFLDQLRMLQVPHGAGMEAMRIEVNRSNLLEDSFAQVSAMNAGELRRWLRVQFVGEPGVDAGGLEREWFLLVCRALFDPSTGLFTPQPGDGAFTINPSSGMANEMHLEYFRFAGRVLGKLLMEHSVAPYHLSLPILKHLLGLPVAFSDLEFSDAELHRHLSWLRANAGADALGLDFTVTLESFGVKEVAELLPGGRDVAVTDDNKEHYLQLRLKHHVLDSTRGQLWHLMRGFYDVIPSHLISVFDYQELELLLCGIPEIDVSEWKRYSRYLGDYRRLGEEHDVIKWFWEVVEAFSEEEKARFLQFCTGTSRLPPHGFKALQSNDGSFRAFSLQSITKRESAFPRAHTCFNKLDLPVYDSKKELEECIGLCICFELTGFTID